MKTLFLFLCMMPLMLPAASAQLPDSDEQGVAETHMLLLEIGPIKPLTGKIRIEVFNAKERVIKRLRVEVSREQHIVEVKDLPAGPKGIRLFHDANDNGKMDTNFLGIPKEGYGFSNNVKGTFGPPSFERWLFDFEENTRISIQLNY